MTLIYFLIVIGILVFVHEFGHFIMAKQAGVRVEKFSLGMGPKIPGLGFKKGDTEYFISALPLGGYVKMAGENPDEESTGSPDEFQSKTVWQRARIAAAGSITNIILAFLIMPLTFMIGAPVEGPAKVGYVEKGSPAEHAGFHPGDVIESINGRHIHDWPQALSLIAVNPNTDITVMVERGGETKTLVLRPAVATDLKIGVSGLMPDLPVEVGGLVSGFPAQKAGLRVGDKIIAANGKTVFHRGQFYEIVQESKGRPIRLTIERDRKRFDVTLSPEKKDKTFLIGILWTQNEERKFGFVESVQLGFEKNVENIYLTFITIKKLLTFSLSIKTLGGPVMIAQMSGQAARIGLSAFLALLALVSLSLGILNLLPIPVLDGGMLLFLVIEAIRRKPLSQKVMAVATNIGAAFLIMLIAVVSYNDVLRVFSGK